MSDRCTRRLARRWPSDRGQTITEYVLLSGLVALMMTAVFGPLGRTVQTTIRQVADRLIRVVAGG